jgi:hypothetical protein
MKLRCGFISTLAMLKPTQSNMVLADLLDWIDFLIPGIKNEGLDYPSNPIPWYCNGIGITF